MKNTFVVCERDANIKLLVPFLEVFGVQIFPVDERTATPHRELVGIFTHDRLEQFRTTKSGIGAERRVRRARILPTDFRKRRIIPPRCMTQMPFVVAIRPFTASELRCSDVQDRISQTMRQLAQRRWHQLLDA